MSDRLLTSAGHLALGLALIPLAAVTVAGQSSPVAARAKSPAPTKPCIAPRTADGQPDLQ